MSLQHCCLPLFRQSITFAQSSDGANRTEHSVAERGDSYTKRQSGRLVNAFSGPSTGSTAQNPIISPAFWSALLLTGQTSAAEAAVLDAIRDSEPDTLTDKSLHVKTVEAAIASSCNSAEPDDFAMSLLPVELARVLWLPPVLRRCFVVYVLCSFSLEDCSRLLNIPPDAVIDAVCQATQHLRTEAGPLGKGHRN